MKDIENNKDKWTASSKSKLSEYNPSSDKTESYIRIGGIESGYEWFGVKELCCHRPSFWLEEQ